MRNTLLAATFLIPITAIGPAFAQDVGGDIGGDVDIDISASDVDAGADVGGDVDADAGGDAGDVDAGGDVGVDVDAGAGDEGGDVDVDAGADAGAEGDADADAGNGGADANVTIGAEGGGDVTLTNDELMDVTVVTNDDVELGTVVGTTTGDDGATVLIIQRADGEGNIRIRATNAQQTEDGDIRVNYSEAEIQQRIAAETEARAGDDVCFFTEADYQGDSFCVGVGASFSQLTGNWNDNISSIQVAEGASVEVCLDAAYTGGCQTFNAATATLPEGWNDMISSFRTR